LLFALEEVMKSVVGRWVEKLGERGEDMTMLSTMCVCVVECQGFETREGTALLCLVTHDGRKVVDVYLHLCCRIWLPSIDRVPELEDLAMLI
jgi:hypothetical protein